MSVSLHIFVFASNILLVESQLFIRGCHCIFLNCCDFDDYETILIITSVFGCYFDSLIKPITSST